LGAKDQRELRDGPAVGQMGGLEMNKCSTCQKDDALEKIRVRDMNLNPPAEYFFCSIFCRNVFINANREFIALDKNYGDTTARRGVI
jgi:hypothetical protein